MRRFACLAPAIAIAACATAPVAPTAPPPSIGQCNAADTLGFVGQRRSPETESAILAATGSTQIRWVRPDMIVTMEYLATRVTVHVDADNRISRIVCG